MTQARVFCEIRWINEPDHVVEKTIPLEPPDVGPLDLRRGPDEPVPPPSRASTRFDQEQDHSIPDRIAVALSGGGTRATVYGLGALLYLIDAGLHRRVVAMSSVSGGSILNAHFAANSDFSTAAPAELDEVAGALARQLTTRGITGSWAVRSYLAALALGLGLAILLVGFSWPVALPWFAKLAVVVGWLSMLLLRGLPLTFTLDRWLLRPDSRKKVLLGEVASDLDHVFCATDLKSVSPFYFSTWDRGYVYSPFYGESEDGRTPLSTVVRASAAFPGGIPPKRIGLRRLQLAENLQRSAWGQKRQAVSSWGRFRTRLLDWWIRKHSESRTRYVGLRHEHVERLRVKQRRIRAKSFRYRSAHLSDGGVWNNLGTQTFFEDGVFRGRFRQRARGGSGPMDPDDSTPFGTIVVDAAVPATRRPLRALAIPGLAELAGFVQASKVLYSNTVDPRLDELAERATREIVSHGRSLTLVASLTESRLDLALRMRLACEQAMPAAASMAARAGKLEPLPPSTQTADPQSDRYVWEVGAESANFIHTPTSLGPLDADTAIDLMLHAYLSTMKQAFVSWNAPLIWDLERSRFERLLAPKS